MFTFSSLFTDETITRDIVPELLMLRFMLLLDMRGHGQTELRKTKIDCPSYFLHRD